MYRSVDLLILFFLFCGGECQNVQLQTDGATEMCIGQSIEYNCIASGSDSSQSLIWRIFQDDGTQFGSDVAYSSFANPSTTMIGGVFTVEQLTMSGQTPLISNISFTVQSSINGYTIVCAASNNQNFTIPIPDPISPDNVTVDPNTFTKSSVNISWTESSFSQSMCFSGYRYNVTSDTPDWNNIIMESTSDTSVMVTDLVPSDDQYCFVVFTYDTGNRNSSGSDPACFIFNVPSITDLDVNDTEYNTTTFMLDVYVEWTEIRFNISDNVVQPIFNGYNVTIVNSTDSMDFYRNSGLLPQGTTNYTFTGILTGRNYNVSVIAQNNVGAGTTTINFDAPGPFVVIAKPTTSMSTMSTSSSSLATPSTVLMTGGSMNALTTVDASSTSTSLSSSPSASATPPVIKDTSTNNVGAIAGGAAGGAVGFLLIIVIILAVVAFVIYRNRQSKSINLPKNAGVIPMEVHVKNPDVGESYYDGDKPPPSSGGGPELATYQDPSTILREQAPSGDLYALPEKKPPPSSQAVGGEYAELDLTNKTAVTASTITPPTAEDPSSVVYSDVRGQ